MRWPWVSRALFDEKCQQVEDLKASNADLLKLALTKTVEPPKDPEEEETATKPNRRLVKDIRAEAEKTLRAKAAQSRKR